MRAGRKEAVGKCNMRIKTEVKTKRTKEKVVKMMYSFLLHVWIIIEQKK